MSREINIIKMDGYGNITMPTDIRATAMSEWEICELFGITAPTFRAAVKAICKSGILKEYEVRHSIRLSDKCSMDVYSLEMVVALAFRIRSYGAERVRNAILEKLYLRKEEISIFFSLFTESKPNSRWQA
jgi:hypothetical protein